MRRAELRTLQIGAIAIVVAASTFNAFELDRFFVPKDLALHLVALVAGAIAMRHVTIARSDRFLVWYLGLSAISAVFATNHWLAFRGLAISVSAAVVFWVARSVVLWVARDVVTGFSPSLAGLKPGATSSNIVNALAFAVVLIAITSLLQAYGLDLAIFSENRVPGGTLGNRNFIAHAAAFGYPLLLFTAFVAERRFVWRGVAVTITTAALVLTRSRAAWLAFAAVLLVCLAAIVMSPAMRRERRTWTRLGALLLFAAGGVAAALLIPNALEWRSRNPYLESVQHVTDFKGGSGHGRLVQYQRSMAMSLHHPLFGVGPGNWAVDYPRFAIREDPSMSDSDAGMTLNPWPSSDWVAFVSERGIVATVLLALFFLRLALSAIRRLRLAENFADAAAAVALLGVLAGAVVTGLFDAVLLLALPTYIVFAAAGALSAPDEPMPQRSYRFVFVACVVIAAIASARSIAQLIAMDMYATRSDRASLSHASSIDPGNYRLQLRVARAGGRSRCAHAVAAHDLYPSAAAARDASRGCR
jgi:O-antigen ligase